MLASLSTEGWSSVPFVFEYPWCAADMARQGAPVIFADMAEGETQQGSEVGNSSWAGRNLNYLMLVIHFNPVILVASLGRIGYSQVLEFVLLMLYFVYFLPKPWCLFVCLFFRGR